MKRIIAILLSLVMLASLYACTGEPANDTHELFALSTQSPARCYVDNINAYSLNEITIYWNSPLVYVMTRLCK